MFPELPPSEYDVGRKRIEPGDDLEIAALLAVAERAAEGAAGFLARAPLRDGLFDMRGEFFVEIAVEALAPKQIGKPSYPSQG
jgi:hypothetical protein